MFYCRRCSVKVIVLGRSFQLAEIPLHLEEAVGGGRGGLDVRAFSGNIVSREDLTVRTQVGPHPQGHAS